MEEPRIRHIRYPNYVRYVFIGFLVLMANSGYLAAFAHYTYFYYANLLLHVVLGALLLMPFFIWMRRFLKFDAHHGKPFGYNAGRLGLVVMLLAGATGFYLLIAGNAATPGMGFWAHAGAGVLACLFCISSIRRAGYNLSVVNIYFYAGRWGLVVFILSGMFPLAVSALRNTFPSTNSTIENPVIPPATWEEAATGGKSSLFYPSPIETIDGDYIKADFNSDAKSCGSTGCHSDIYQQWERSNHRASRLANRWYRPSVSYFQAISGEAGSKFCAGCHTPARLLNGATAKELAAMDAGDDGGVSCVICHGIAWVKGTQGNASFAVRRPEMLELAGPANSTLKPFHDTLLRWAPLAHRRSFSRPFLRSQSAEFCSSCHKLSMSRIAPGEKWQPGTNHYDSWQNSHFAGWRALDFFPFAGKKTCIDCHMPLVASTDPAGANGLVRSHEFAAQAGVPSELEPAKAFRSGADRVARGKPLALTLIALSPAQFENALSRLRDQAAQQNGLIIQNQVDNLIGAIRQGMKGGRPGRSDSGQKAADSIRVDAVISTNEVGHYISLGRGHSAAWRLELGLLHPGRQMPGTGEARLAVPVSEVIGSTPIVDRFFAQDDSRVDEGGPRMLTLSPGAPLLISQVFAAPPYASAPLSIQALLRRNAGDSAIARDEEAPGRAAGEEADEGPAPQPAVLDTEPVSAELLFPAGRSIEGEVLLSRPHGAEGERWLAYGAGLHRNGDYALAAYAFMRAVLAAPGDMNNLTNLAWALIEMRQIPVAIQILREVEKLDPDFGRAQFFLGVAYELSGDLIQARRHLGKARDAMPDDLASLLELGHIFYRQRDYTKAVRVMRQAILIQPENPIAHYFRMRANERLGKQDKAAIEAKLFAQFSHISSDSLDTAETLYLFGQSPVYLHYSLPRDSLPK